MSKKIIYYSKSKTKVERGLFLDSLKHLKVNLSTLMKHFQELDFYNIKDVKEYLDRVPNNRKAKFPDMKKIGLIDYEKQEEPILTVFGQKIKNDNQDYLTLGLLLMNYHYEGVISIFRPYYLLIDIIYKNNIKELTSNILTNILSCPILEVLNINLKNNYYNNLPRKIKMEIKRPTSYVMNYLKTIKVIDDKLNVNQKTLMELIDIGRSSLISTIKRSNYQLSGRPGKEQLDFRNNLIKIYDGKCFIRNEQIIMKQSKEKGKVLLDASHIVPFKMGGSFSINNGMLLSYDLHKLFDMGLLTIKYTNGNFHSELSKKIVRGSYLDPFHNKQLSVVPNQNTPNPLALEYHNKNIFQL